MAFPRMPLVGLALACVVVGGCVGDVAKPAEFRPAQPSSAPDVEVSRSLGAISGLVVDESLYPIADAALSLEEPSATGATLATGSTGPGGEFGFTLLEPGTYRIRATHPSFGSGAVLAEVEAGEVSKVTIPLDPLARNDPYLLLYIKSGIMRCGWANVRGGAYCPGANTVWNNQNSLSYNVTAGHQATIVEKWWQRSSEYMDHDVSSSIDEQRTWSLVGRGIGLPVLRKVFLPSTMEPPVLLYRYATFPESGQSFALRTVTFYDGQYQKEINQTAGPACPYVSAFGYCSGVGVALDFKFSEYVSVFVNEAPTSVGDYSAVPDA